MPIETCENCERQIGKLEEAYVHKGHIICGGCNELLRKKPKSARKKHTADPEEPTDNQLQYAERLGIEVPLDVTKWELSDLIDQAVTEKEENKVQTIEKTGKELKAGMLIGALVAIIATIVTFSSDYAGGPFIVIGILIFVFSKVLAWWYHG